MSLLKMIFGNTNPPLSKGTPLRNLFQEYADSLPPLHARNDHNKCMTVMTSILRFGYSDSSPIPQLAKYMTDACLFELACYTLASVDFWVFNKAPSKRQQIQQILFEQLDASASRSGFLQEQAAYGYGNSRLRFYGQIFCNNFSVEGLHYKLKHALDYASTHPNPILNLDEESPIFGNPIEGLLLTKTIMAWDTQRMIDMNSTLLTFS